MQIVSFMKRGAAEATFKTLPLIKLKLNQTSAKYFNIYRVKAKVLEYYSDTKRT